LRKDLQMEPVREGFDVFLHDGEKAFGAVRQVRHKAITVYVENGGDFEVPLAAVRDVHDQKVVLDGARLDARLREAIRRAHGGEDPRIP
jgi:hypothetical protein